MKTKASILILLAAALGIVGGGTALTGCGESKPPVTSAPGTDRVAAEKQDEKDVDTVHTSAGTTTGTQSTDGK